MSDPDANSADGASTARPAPSFSMQTTPNAEKYLLEADAMRSRQLRSSLLHGSRRTWREQQRIWPAVIVGVICVAVIVAGLAVRDAFQTAQENQKREELERSQSAPALIHRMEHPSSYERIAV